MQEVVSGEFNEKRIEFAHLQLIDYIPERTQDWLILVESCVESVSASVGVARCVFQHVLADDAVQREELLQEVLDGL